MGLLRKTFRAVDAGDGSDGQWAAELRALWPAAENALTEEACSDEGAVAARRLFETHMPELVPALEMLAGQLQLPKAGAFLTLAGLRPFFAGCSQAGGGGILLRNYDFDPDEVEGVIARSNLLRPVIGMQDCGWGLLDGMNDAGLAASLTFGGRFVSGPGFAVLIVVRYLLETCETVGQALAKLATLPVSLPQNLTLVDPGRAVTVYVGPDIPMTLADDACATNHQHFAVPDAQEKFTRTQHRLAAIRAAGAAEADVAVMLKPPLYQTVYDQGLGTVYTARYRPGEGTVTYYWPGEAWEQSFDCFTPDTRTVTLG
jgi:predicted choloylglycine hydrolase